MRKFKLSSFLLPILLLAIMAIVIIAQMRSACAIQQIFEYYNTGDDGQVSIYGVYWEAQTFTVGSTAHNISSVNLKLYRFGYPENLTVSIRATSGGVYPTGADLTDGTINATSLTNSTSGLWYGITLTEYTLSADTKYAIVVRSIGGNATNFVNWRYDSTTPTYSGGNRNTSEDSGVNWASAPTWDFMFEVWGNELPSPPPSQVVNLATFPTQLALMLGTPLFVGQILASTIFLCLFLFPAIMLTGYFGGSGAVLYTILVVGMPISGVCVALGWLPVWLYLVTCLLIALMFASRMRELITGGPGKGD